MSKLDILILDKPTTGLDPLMRDAVVSLIKEQKSLGRTIFMSSHMFNELEETCDRIAFIKAGRLVDVIDMATIRDFKEREYRIGFETDEELNCFIKKGHNIANINNSVRHLNIRINDSQINELFKELADFNLRYIQSDNGCFVKFQIYNHCNVI